MTWIQAHMMDIVTYWGLAWAVAMALSNTFPQGSTGWKIVHTFLSISPLDFVKTIKTIGAEFVPPAAGVLAFILLSTSACGGPPAKTAAQARAEARAGVTTVEAAWMATAHACVDAATISGKPEILDKCATVLDPIRVSLEAADDTVNAWTDATSNAPLACRVEHAALAMQDAVTVLGAPPAAVLAVKDAVLLAGTLGCTQ